MSKVGSYNEEMQQLEYAALRQEILQNKSYIFERPLLIVGAFVAAITQLGKSDFAILMPPILTLIAMILLNIFLFYHFLVRSPPGKMKNLIERERAIWMVLFEEN